METYYFPWNIGRWLSRQRIWYHCHQRPRWMQFRDRLSLMTNSLEIYTTLRRVNDSANIVYWAGNMSTNTCRKGEKNALRRENGPRWGAPGLKFVIRVFFRVQLILKYMPNEGLNSNMRGTFSRVSLIRAINGPFSALKSATEMTFFFQTRTFFLVARTFCTLRHKILVKAGIGERLWSPLVISIDNFPKVIWLTMLELSTHQPWWDQKWWKHRNGESQKCSCFSNNFTKDIRPAILKNYEYMYIQYISLWALNLRQDARIMKFISQKSLRDRPWFSNLIILQCVPRTKFPIHWRNFSIYLPSRRWC